MAYTTIDDPEAYFQIKLYTGTGSSNALTFDGDTDMSPNLVWIKSRSRTDKQTAWDTVRGTGRCLFPSENNADEDQGTGVTAFGSDGFTVGAMNDVNYTDATFAAWCWKESATAGFDMVSWTVPGSGSTTISHSLSAVPKLIISKSTDTGTTDWETYHNGIGNANTIQVNTNAASGDNNAYNDTDPTSSVFSITTAGFGANRAIISYLFAEVKGYSKFGKYTGNGQTDGPYVFTGFRPAFCLIKRSDATASWVLIDNKRSTSSNGNPVDKYFNNNTTDTETTGTTYTKFDFCANGIKVTEDNTDINASGGTYLYIAFAEAPLVNSEGIPGNAR